MGTINMPYLFFYIFTNLAFYFAEVKLLLKILLDSSISFINFSCISFLPLDIIILKVSIPILLARVLFSFKSCMDTKFFAYNSSILAPIFFILEYPTIPIKKMKIAIQIQSIKIFVFTL